WITSATCPPSRANCPSSPWMSAPTKSGRSRRDEPVRPTLGARNLFRFNERMKTDAQKIRDASANRALTRRREALLRSTEQTEVRAPGSSLHDLHRGSIQLHQRVILQGLDDGG